MKVVEKSYPIKEAVQIVKEKCKCKFDSTVELHINLTLDNKKQEQTVRFITVLPFGTGKTKKVAVLASKKIASADLELSESDIEKLANGTIKPRIDFDVLITEPRFMPKLAKAAKVLGPAGAMPNPKNGTVSEDVEKAVEQVKKGKVEVRLEPNGKTIHTIIGKRSFKDTDLTENFREIMESLEQNKPAKATDNWIKTVHLSTTMSPSVLVQL